MTRKPIKVIHPAPKKAKTEVREFKTLDEAVAYVKRNEKRIGGKK